MKIIKLAAVAALCVMLGGCDISDVVKAVAALCKYQPDAASLEKFVTKFTGLPPGAQIGIDVVNSVAEAICAEAQKQKPASASAKIASTGGPVRASVKVQGVTITGKYLP